MVSSRRSILLALPLVFALPASAETASQVFKQDAPSVVVVMTYSAAGKATELGSGVKLSDGSVATNCHVLKDGTRYRVRYQGKVYRATLDKSDWNRDVCSLDVPGLPAPPVVLGSTITLQVGANVYAIGTPEGLRHTLSEGIVSSLRPVRGGSYIQTTAAISPGSSGGGLFDDHGRLLGLTSFFISKGQQLNFALPVEWIEALPQHSTTRVASLTSEVDWLNHAQALESRKDWKGLEALAERWVKADPSTAFAWFALGEAADKLDQYASAIAADLQALKLNPKDENTWVNLGAACYSEGQYAPAIAAERLALKLNPQDEHAWADVGVAYTDAGQYTSAIAAERQALKLNPKDVDVWANVGVAYFDADQYTSAIAAERQALKLNPKDENAWVNVGVAYFDADQYTSAIAAERQALKLNPQDAAAWLDLGLSYYSSGQQQQALDVYQHLKSLDPAFAEKLFDVIFPK